MSINSLLTTIFRPLFLLWDLIKARSSIEIEVKPGASLLIIAVAGIGDTLLSIPAIRALRESFPELKVTVWVSDRETGTLFQEKEGPKSIFVYPFSRFFTPFSFLANNIKFLWGLRKKGFSHVLIAEPSQNVISAVAAFISGAEVRVGIRYRLGNINDTDFLLTHSLSFSYKKHVVESNLGLLRFFGIHTPSREVCIALSDRERKEAEDRLNESGLKGRGLLVGMHIGANPNQQYKCWKPERFAQVADFLAQELGAGVMLFGVEGERPQVEAMLQNAKQTPVSWVGLLNLRQTAALISRCSLFISNDSGPMHLAVAVKTPVVAVFGPTHPQKNAPWGEHKIVRKDMECNPCYDWEHSRIADCDHIRCMNDISAEEVIEAARSMLDKR